jgi:hypothetical protein
VGWLIAIPAVLVVVVVYAMFAETFDWWPW